MAELHRSLTPGLIIADNGTLRLDDENQPQPDVMVMILKRPAGRRNSARMIT